MRAQVGDGVVGVPDLGDGDLVAVGGSHEQQLAFADLANRLCIFDASEQHVPLPIVQFRLLDCSTVHCRRSERKAQAKPTARGRTPGAGNWAYTHYEKGKTPASRW